MEAFVKDEQTGQNSKRYFVYLRDNDSNQGDYFTGLRFKALERANRCARVINSALHDEEVRNG